MIFYWFYYKKKIHLFRQYKYIKNKLFYSSSGSQNNLCNGGMVPSSFGSGLVRKVHNHSPNAQKKNLVSVIVLVPC